MNTQETSQAGGWSAAFAISILIWIALLAVLSML
jgi:hypothetical protein